MGRILKAFRVFWFGANALSTLQWIMGLPFAGILGVIAGWGALAAHLPPVVIAVLAFGAATFAYVLYVALLLQRRQAAGIGVHDEISAEIRKPARPAAEGSKAWRKNALNRKREKERSQAASLARQLKRETGIDEEPDTILDALERAHERLGSEPAPQPAPAAWRKRKDTDSLHLERSRAAIQYRNCTLAEALGWAVEGEWGRPQSLAGIPVTIRVVTHARDFLPRFTRLAGEGKLTFWGKRADPGYYEKIPQSHWQDHHLTIADIFGSVVSSGGDPYRELRLNKAEVERAWPHEG